MKSNEKSKANHGQPSDDLPRLVYISGRTKEAVDTILDDVASRPLDAEYVRLLHEAFKYKIPAHLYRGYGIFYKKSVHKRAVVEYNDDLKPTLLVFGGYDQQWGGIGASLMKIPMFQESIERCHEVLLTKDIDLVNLILQNSSKALDNTNNTILGVAIQVALIDVLKAIEIKPDGFLGATTGEISCAYLDGCLSLEQAILAAFHIGSCIDTKKTKVELLNNLKQIIPSPKPKSPTWIPTIKHSFCSPESLIDAICSRFSLPEKLPYNSFFIELSPQSLLPNSLQLLRQTQDNSEVLLDGIGQLYLLGCDPRIEKIYPPVEFPVSRGTPMISPLIKWYYKDDWYVPKEEINKNGERVVSVLITDGHMEYISGHVIDGKTFHLLATVF